MLKKTSKILLVEDNPDHAELAISVLQGFNKRNGEEFRVYLAKNGDECIETISRDTYDAVVMDYSLPMMTGLEILTKIRESGIRIPVIMVTARGDEKVAAEAIKKGASEYLPKDESYLERLPSVVRRSIDDFERRQERERVEALRLQRIEEENRFLREQMGKRLNFHGLIGKNYRMQKIYENLSIISPTDSTVLILGETGTGKDLLAQAIHYNSHRKEKPFIKVDCGALSESILESELFGHERGAFTHAYQRRIGRFEYANGGTVFIDEIGEIPSPLQIKLLRILEEKKFERVGSNKTIDVDVRIIAATNRDLERDIQEGRFRSDLFYRLNVIQFSIPPLRERTDDIPLLANHFLKEFGKKLKKKVRSLSPGALQTLMDYPWPGNVRELENVIEKTLLLNEGEVIESVDLPCTGEIEGTKNSDACLYLPFRVAKKTVVNEFERKYFSRLLEWTGGNISRASKKAGMDYKSFYEKLKLYQINPLQFKMPS